MKCKRFKLIAKSLVAAFLIQAAGSSNSYAIGTPANAVSPYGMGVKQTQIRSTDNLPYVSYEIKKFGRDPSRPVRLGKNGEQFYVGCIPRIRLIDGAARSLRAVYCNANGKVLAYVDPTTTKTYFPHEVQSATVIPGSTSVTRREPSVAIVETVFAKSLKEAFTYIDDSNEKLIAMRHSADAAPGLLKLSEVPDRLIIIYDIPDSPTEIANVHPGADVNDAKWEIEEGARILNDIKKHKWDKEVVLANLRGNRSARDIALETISRKLPGDLILLMGCNHKGRLMFHDKSSVACDEIGDAWPVGCNVGYFLLPTEGLRIATFREISYREAGLFLWATSSLYSQALSRGEMLLRLQRSATKQFWIPIVKNDNSKNQKEG